MSDRRPSGHRTRHMPRWAESGTTLGLRGLKRRPPRCVRPGRASAPEDMSRALDLFDCLVVVFAQDIAAQGLKVS
jgi:hypothetical protein